MLYLIPVTLVLPVRSPKALYFRSFSSDKRGLATLFDLRKALRGRYRLAGIRPLKQRASTFAKHLAAACFSFRYASLRYMNLEGSDDDWLPRLWRTMRTARCAFVNVFEITDWLIVEARLCISTLGVERVLFIGDGATDNPKLQQMLAVGLGLCDGRSKDIRVVARNAGEDLPSRDFIEAVERFIDSLPSGTPVDNGSGVDVLKRYAETKASSFVRS